MDSTSAGRAHIADLWDRAFSSQPAPSFWLAAATAALALAAVLPAAAWRLTRNAVTIAHEGGHGLAALLTRRRLQGIRLHSDTSGLTLSRGKPTGTGMLLTAAAGYTAPSLLGLGGAWLLAAGYPTVLLWSTMVLLIAMLVMIRNAYGVLAVVATGTAFFLVSWLTAPEVQTAFAYGAVWFLLFGGIRPVFELQAMRRQGGAPDSDADLLARLTNIPAALWLLFFHAVSLGSLMGGGRWLLAL